MVQKKRKARLNVKDPEAHRLAQAIAEETGETLTRAVTEARRERYQRLHKGDPETLAAEIRAIADRAAAHIKKPHLDHAEFLYNEHGFPSDPRRLADDSHPRERLDCELYVGVFRRAGIVVEPVTVDQAHAARQAFHDFGKGRHPAGLNYGDCFAYALAKTTGEPLLFKGEDFKKTDIVSAL